MKFIFIDQNHFYYKKAVDLRVSLFFQGMDNVSSSINDKYEANSIHLVCLNKDDEVIGTGRVAMENQQGIISQMAIKKEFQKAGIGKRIMQILIDKCLECKVDEITLSARKTAIDFYKQFDFHTQGELYTSKKTKILHQKMIRKGTQ